MADKDNPGDDWTPVAEGESLPARERDDAVHRGGKARVWRRAVVAVLLVGVAASGTAWVLRKRIADDLIASELKAMGLPAQYKVRTISPSEQVITDLVIGDPAKPDLTVKEVHVATRLWWGLPGIGRITLVAPRLYGTVHHGKPSFGALDKVLFTGSKEPFRLPDLDIAVRDGRALIDADQGRVGLKLDGQGELRDGFTGTLAALTPGLAMDGCRTGRLTAYGKLWVRAERPSFEGPIRLASASCPAKGLTLAQSAVQAKLTLDPHLDGGDAVLGVAGGAFSLDRQRAASLKGSVRASLRGGNVTARYTLTGSGIVTAFARLSTLTFDGQGRGAADLAHFDAEGTVSGTGLVPGDAPDRALAQVQAAGAGTLLLPLMEKMRGALVREGRGSRFQAEMVARRGAEGYSLVVPTGTLTGRSGQTMLALSRLQLLTSGHGMPRMSGNFFTGGVDLPRITGRMEAGRDGHLGLQVSMEEYRAGNALVALPRLSVHQAPGGALTFGGAARLSGALPGGEARNLVLPLDGHVSAGADLALWERCTDVSFDGLMLANLTLDARKLSVCPTPGKAIVTRQGGTWHIAAGLSALDLTGKLGATPVHIASGPVGFAWPGMVRAQNLRIALGPQESASLFHVADLDAKLGSDIAGTFAGADVSLAAVPLDLHDTTGQWAYANGALTLSDASFRLVDREKVNRFEPMVAEGGTLRLFDNRITAEARLLEPGTRRLVTQVSILHDLRDASGHADLAVPGITFDKQLQAPQLSALALGIVSDLKGTVTGSGRIDWNAKGVTSHGQFASKGLDFAAAFGPVTGLSGTIHFTDLLGLVTAPNQSVAIKGINPGIAVSDGVLSYQIKPGHELQVNGAKWPFMDGTLELLPTTMRLGIAETRHYTLKVTGLNAATFVQNLQVGNINATGVFDGEVPLVFDQNGGRIEEGVLRSRDPGGSVAYLGALTYKDLGTMGNFAFQALRSVKYKAMEIDLGGSLSGDILTRIRFDGLSQGDGATQNFLTKRIAKLPIRFIVNIKAPFFSLFGSVRSLYDPTFVTDPRTLGLIGTDGKPIKAPVLVAPPPPVPSASSNIQPSDSEKRP